MKLSVVIPARNEEGCLPDTLHRVHQALARESIDHEILLVDDGSTDRTAAIVENLAAEIPTLRRLFNAPKHGFGLAVRVGIENSQGDAVAIFMADASDTPQDLIRFFRVLEKGEYDCVFGSRFLPGARVVDYPVFKYVLNRLVNKFIQVLFGLSYNDVTNAFKMYRRPVLDGLTPLLSHHFNLTVELPLKAIVRGYRYTVLPNDWIQRKTGQSKLKLKEMGSRYLFIILYCFIEKWLSRGDYRAKPRKDVKPQ